MERMEECSETEIDRQRIEYRNRGRDIVKGRERNDTDRDITRERQTE